MSNNLPALGGNFAANLPSVAVDDAVFESLAKRGNFLPRLVLYSKQGEVLDGKIKPGHYGIPTSKESLTDLGPEVDLIPLARRAKAIDMRDRDNIVESFDPKSEVFARIQAKSSERDSGCAYGVEFLCLERTTGKLVSWFCGSKTTRAVAGEIYPFLPQAPTENAEGRGPQAFTMGSQLIKKADYRWHGPTVKRCTTPFTNAPSEQELIDEVQKFTNPPSTSATNTEVADGDADDR